MDQSQVPLSYDGYQLPMAGQMRESELVWGRLVDEPDDCAPPPPPPTDQVWATTLFEQIGRFMADHALPPTPENYALAHAAVAGDAAAAAAAAAGPPPEGNTAMVAGLIDEAQARVGAVASLIARSGDEARDYGNALEDGVAGPRALPAIELVAELVGLTRSMIHRTREAESRLRDMGGEMDALHQKLSEAQTLAGRDALTGLPNRRALRDSLSEAIAATRLASRALSLAYCDVDHFKTINDRHGHDVGDGVLRRVAETLEEIAGPDAVVGRYGGEEFVILFDGLDLDAAAARVEAARRDLASRKLRSRRTGEVIGKVTFSAGVAALHGDEGEEELLRRADAALYRAKQAGRDRIALDRPDEAEGAPPPVG